MLVGVSDFRSTRELIALVDKLGYQNFGEIILSGRLYLRRRGPPHFNIAVAEQGGAFWHARVVLRDYLRAHPDEATAYSNGKRALYAGGGRMFSPNSQGKEPLLSTLMERTRR